MKTITAQELKQKIERKDKFTLLEALADESYRRAHIPGAVRIPHDQSASQWAPKLVPDKEREVVTYCMNPL